MPCMLAFALLVMAAAGARADEVPIAGVVKAVDAGTQTFIVGSTARGLPWGPPGRSAAPAGG